MERDGHHDTAARIDDQAQSASTAGAAKREFERTAGQIDPLRGFGRDRHPSMVTHGPARRSAGCITGGAAMADIGLRSYDELHPLEVLVS